MAVEPRASKQRPIALGLAERGFSGRIHSICVEDPSPSLSPAEMESRLIELGFIEGASIEILHEGAFRRDPIAVRVDNITVAVRRREAMAIRVI